MKRLVTAYMEAEASGEAQDILMGLFSLLRAQHLMMWNHHWEVSGVGSYGAHLLFARLYDENLEDDVDELAEKLMGYFGPDAVRASDTLAGALAWIRQWEAAEPECIFHRSLKSEQDLQDECRDAYDSLKELGTLPLGMDDFIMSLASKHEAHIYLLQQWLDDPQGMGQRLASEAPTDEHLFFDNPQKREVREFADSKAVSNDPGVAQKSEQPGAAQKAKQAPPTPEENAKKPGAEEFSTLNRLVLDTAEPVNPPPPKSHPKLASLVEQYASLGIKSASARDWIKRDGGKFVEFGSSRSVLIYEMPGGSFTVLRSVGYDEQIQDARSLREARKLAEEMSRY